VLWDTWSICRAGKTGLAITPIKFFSGGFRVTTQDRGFKWAVVALLWGIALLNYLDRQVIFAQFSLIQRDLHATCLHPGLISCVFLWVYTDLSPSADYMADRWGRARIIFLSLLIWSVATWITAQVQSIEQMLFSRMLTASGAVGWRSAMAGVRRLPY
jgi:MFS family permease